MIEIRYWTSDPHKGAELWRSRLGLSGEKFSLVYDRKSPDYLLATEHIYFERLAKNDFLRLYSPRRINIFWAGECISPDLNIFDYAMTYDKGLSCGDRITRRPVISIFGSFNRTPLDVAPSNLSEVTKRKSKFCNFIYSNPYAHPHRDWMFHTISKYRRVDAIGPHLHNCDCATSRWVRNFEQASVEMKEPYKFSIASENARFFGYTSEKIITSFLARTIPVYWGNPDIANEFNPRAFLNANDLAEDELIDRIRRIDSCDDEWKRMLAEPPMTHSQFEKAKVEEIAYQIFMDELFTRPITSALRRPEGYWPDNYKRSLFSFSAHQVTRKNRLMKALGRETRLARWILSKVHPIV